MCFLTRNQFSNRHQGCLCSGTPFCHVGFFYKQSVAVLAFRRISSTVSFIDISQNICLLESVSSHYHISLAKSSGINSWAHIMVSIPYSYLFTHLNLFFFFKLKIFAIVKQTIEGRIYITCFKYTKMCMIHNLVFLTHT